MNLLQSLIHQVLKVLHMLFELLFCLCFALVVGAIVFSLSDDSALALIGLWLGFGFALLTQREVLSNQREQH